MKAMVEDDTNTTVESEDALYNNRDYCDDGEPQAQIRKRDIVQRKKKQVDDERDCKVIYEKDLKKGSIKSIVKLSKQDLSKNPQPFNLGLSPFIHSIIMSVASSKRQDFLETTLEITSSGILGFVQQMDERYNMMCDITSSVSTYNTMKGSNVEIPYTEVFPEKDYKKTKEKVMVTSSVNSWLHKYRKVFNIEYSDVFSAVVLLAHSNSDYANEEAVIRCEDGLSYFYTHLDNKIEKMSELPSELISSLLRCLDYLSAIGVKEKTIYLEPSSGKGNVKFIVNCGNHEEGYYRYIKNRTTNGIFSKKR